MVSAGGDHGRDIVVVGIAVLVSIIFGIITPNSESLLDPRLFRGEAARMLEGILTARLGRDLIHKVRPSLGNVHLMNYKITVTFLTSRSGDLASRRQ